MVLNKGDKGLYIGSLNDSASSWEKEHIFMLKHDGKVGIGTDDPDETLELYGYSPKIKITNTGETDAGILFVDRDDESRQKFEIMFNASNQDLHIRSDDNNGADIMTITHGGNVGIGKDNPGHPLDVNGTLRCQTSLTIGSTTLDEDQLKILIALCNGNLIINLKNSGHSDRYLYVSGAKRSTAGNNKYVLATNDLDAEDEVQKWKIENPTIDS
jgi:hypothetical protein